MLHMDVHPTNTNDVPSWLHKHIKAYYGAFFAVICWHIRKARNIKIFQDKVQVGCSQPNSKPQ